MKRLLMLMVLILALGCSAGGSAAAAARDPGTPGAANCHGQTVVYLTHLGFGGLGRPPSPTGLSVQELQALIDDPYCATP